MKNTEKLVGAFASALNIDSSICTDDLSYQSIVEWDSISHMVLISTLEETFGVSLETDDVIDLSSILKAKEILSKYSIQF